MNLKTLPPTIANIYHFVKQSWHGRKNGQFDEFKTHKQQFYDEVVKYLEAKGRIPEGKRLAMNMTSCDVILVAFVDAESERELFEL